MFNSLVNSVTEKNDYEMTCHNHNPGSKLPVQSAHSFATICPSQNSKCKNDNRNISVKQVVNSRT